MPRIKDPIGLSFNPEDPNLPPEAKEIFSNPIARTMYMAYKQGHLEGPKTKRTILDLTQHFEKNGLPEDAKAFHEIMNTSLIVTDQKFSTELYGYLVNKKELKYEVNLPQS